MAPDLHTALARITEVVMFENWLRFYFISEEEGEKLFIRLPDPAMAKLRENYKHLVGLAERLNNTEIDHNTSVSAVCLFVASEIDGIAIPERLIGEVFDSSRFHFELQLFNSWVQSHEDQLDASFMEFSLWLRMYHEWKNSEEVQEYLKTAGVDVDLSARKTSETTH